MHENDFPTSPHQPLQSDATTYPIIRYQNHGPLPTGAMISSLTTCTASKIRSCSSWQSSGTVASRYDPGESLLSLCSSPWSRSPSNARWQMVCTYKVRGWADGQVDAVHGDRAMSPLRHAQFKQKCIMGAWCVLDGWNAQSATRRRLRFHYDIQGRVLHL